MRSILLLLLFTSPSLLAGVAFAQPQAGEYEVFVRDADPVAHRYTEDLRLRAVSHRLDIALGANGTLSPGLPEQVDTFRVEVVGPGRMQLRNFAGQTLCAVGNSVAFVDRLSANCALQFERGEMPGDPLFVHRVGDAIRYSDRMPAWDHHGYLAPTPGRWLAWSRGWLTVPIGSNKHRQAFSFRKPSWCTSVGQRIKWKGEQRHNHARYAKHVWARRRTAGHREDATNGNRCGRAVTLDAHPDAMWGLTLGSSLRPQAIRVWRGPGPASNMEGAILATSASVQGEALRTATDGVVRYRLSGERLNILRPPLGGREVRADGPPSRQLKPIAKVSHMLIYRPGNDKLISIQEVEFIAGDVQ